MGLKVMVNGRACSGKNQVGDYLASKYGFKQISFAEPIYKIARELFNMKEKERELLILIGDKMREIDKDVFVKWVLKNIDENDNIVITDLRRDNEYILSKQAGFIPIRVKADLNTRIERAIQRDGHIPNIELWEGHSETGADNFEYYEIENNESEEELYKQIDKFINKLTENSLFKNNP